MEKELRKAIVPTLTCIVLSGLVAFLLARSGPVYTYLSLDLSYFVGPVIAFLVLRLGGKLAKIFMPGLAGKLLAYSLSGAFFAVVLYMLVSWASLLPEVEDTLLFPISPLGGYVVLCVVGITINGIGGILGEHGESRWASPATRAIGFLMVGCAIFSIIRPFDQWWEFAPSVGVGILVGFVASAVSSLAKYGEYSKTRFVVDACQWMAQSHLRMFVLGALLYSYVALIRPLIADNFTYMPIVEWGIVCLIAWRVYRGVRTTIRDRYSAPLKLSTWGKHAQELEEKLDADLARLGDIQKEFVEKGNRSGLLVSLVIMLYENGWDEDRICHTLVPLIHHEDNKMPWYAFVWEQRRIQSRSENARKKLLADVISTIMQQPGNVPENVEVKI